MNMAVDGDRAGLSLRFGAHGVDCRPADVEAFRGVGCKPGAQVRAPVVHEIGVLGATREPRGDALLFVQHVAYGIPTHDDADTTPALTDWCMRPALFGYVASIAPRRSAAPRRVAWVAAACLPLMWPVEASAAPDPTPDSSPVRVQRPTPKRAVVPELPEPVGDAQPEPDAGTDTDPDPVDESPSADASDDVADPEPPAPPNPFEGPSMSDRAAQDAAWQGVDGEQVVLELKGGKRMRGRVGAVQRDTFTLIERGTGVVIVLPKSGVRSLRVYAPAPIPDDRGSGLLIGGGVLTAVATPVFATGLAFLAVCPSCTGLNVSLLVVGGGGLAAGIPMIVVGSRRRRAYRKALREHQVSASFGRTRLGWSGGLRFRF